jgi:hypothetical protein
VQVNAITKSGTNQLSGLFRGNFRNSDWFNAEEPVLHRVVPINNQQLSVAGGGPIVRDRLHYFGNFEYEREPRSSIWNTPYPIFNRELHGDNSIKLGGARMDYQISSEVRLMGKGAWGRRFEARPRANNSPAATNTNEEHNNEGIGQLTQVLSNRAVNEVRVGYAFFNLANANLTTWSNHWQKASGINTGSPRISFTGFNVTGNSNHPRHQDRRFGRSATTSRSRMTRAAGTTANRREVLRRTRSRRTAGSAWASSMRAAARCRPRRS